MIPAVPPTMLTMPLPCMTRVVAATGDALVLLLACLLRLLALLSFRLLLPACLGDSSTSGSSSSSDSVPLSPSSDKLYMCNPNVHAEPGPFDFSSSFSIC
jgi:hypothetical protein